MHMCSKCQWLCSTGTYYLASAVLFHGRYCFSFSDTIWINTHFYKCSDIRPETLNGSSGGEQIGLRRLCVHSCPWSWIVSGLIDAMTFDEGTQKLMFKKNHGCQKANSISLISGNIPIDIDKVQESPKLIRSHQWNCSIRSKVTYGFSNKNKLEREKQHCGAFLRLPFENCSQRPAWHTRLRISCGKISGGLRFSGGLCHTGWEIKFWNEHSSPFFKTHVFKKYCADRLLYRCQSVRLSRGRPRFDSWQAENFFYHFSQFFFRRCFCFWFLNFVSVWKTSFHHFCANTCITTLTIHIGGFAVHRPQSRNYWCRIWESERVALWIWCTCTMCNVICSFGHKKFELLGSVTQLANALWNNPKCMQPIITPINYWQQWIIPWTKHWNSHSWKDNAKHHDLWIPKCRRSHSGQWAGRKGAELSGLVGVWTKVCIPLYGTHGIFEPESASLYSKKKGERKRKREKKQKTKKKTEKTKKKDKNSCTKNKFQSKKFERKKIIFNRKNLKEKKIPPARSRTWVFRGKGGHTDIYTTGGR